MIRFSKNGFSLIEMMIVVGVASIIALGMTTLMADMTKGANNIRSQFDGNQITADLNRAMGDPNSCTGSLKADFNAANVPTSPGGPPVAPAIWATTIPITKLSFYNSTGGDIQDIGGGNASNFYPELNISQMVINNISRDGTNPNLYYGNVEIDYSFKPGTPPIFPSIASTVYFTTTTVGATDQLTSCSKTLAGSGAGAFFQWGTNGPLGIGATIACPAGYTALYHGGMFETANNAAASTSQMLCGEPVLAIHGYLQWSGNASAPWNGASFAVTNGCTFCVGPTYSGCFPVWGTNVCPVVAGFNITKAYSGTMASAGSFGGPGGSAGEVVCSNVVMPGPANDVSYFTIGGNGFTPMASTPCAICCQ